MSSNLNYIIPVAFSSKKVCFLDNQGMITAIVLAAGKSQRMGEAKLLLPWPGGTILSTTLTNLTNTKLKHIFIISGAYRQKIEGVAAKFALPTIYNPNHAQGEMLSSLQAGIRAVDTATAAVLVMLGDMPLISAETINHLITTFQHSDKTIIVPTFEGKRGHPVIFGRTHFPALLALDGHKGQAPRHLLRKIPNEIQFVPVSTQSILIDFDTKAIYDRWYQKTSTP